MPFRIWQRRESLPPPVIVAPTTSARLLALAAQANLSLTSTPPAGNDYILVLEPEDPIPADLPPHIPVLDAQSPELPFLLKQALLYIEAHRRLR
jgi:hypothetical protein